MLRTKTNVYVQLLQGPGCSSGHVFYICTLTLHLLCLGSCPKPPIGLIGFVSSLSEFYLKTFLSSFRSVDSGQDAELDDYTP